MLDRRLIFRQICHALLYPIIVLLRNGVTKNVGGRWRDCPCATSTSLDSPTPSRTRDEVGASQLRLGQNDMGGRLVQNDITGCLRADLGHANPPDPTSVVSSTKIHQAEHRLGQQVYKQMIKVSSVGTTVYVDEGHGGLA